MNYTHDPKKLAINVSKHLIWFDKADAFEWEHAVVRVDNRKAYPETRFVAMAPIDGRLFTMVFCFRETAVRIISLRKANRREVTEYENQN